VAILAAAALAAPEGYQPLQPRTEWIEVDGTSVALTFEPWARFAFEGGRARIDLYVEGDLGDFQRKLPAIAGGRKKNQECGERVTVSNAAIQPMGTEARLTADVHYEKWVCTYAKVPVLQGAKVTFQRRRTSKVRLLAQNGLVCADLRPVIVDEGHAVRLDGRVTCVRPTGSFGVVVDRLGLERQLENAVERELDKALDANVLALALPPAFRPHRPRITRLDFADRGGGALGLILGGTVALSAEEGRRLLGTLGLR